MKILYEDFTKQFNTSEINRQFFDKSIIPYITKAAPPDSSTSILTPVVGGCIAVQSPVSLIIDTDTVYKHPNAINFIFEIKSIDAVIPMLILRLFNIQFASTLNRVIKSDSIFVAESGVNIEENEQEGIIISGGQLTHHHIFTLPRSYLIYVGVPCDKSSKIQYTQEQCDELVDNGIQDFYNILVGAYKSLPTTVST